MNFTKAFILTLFALTQGCASHPLFMKWDFTVNPSDEEIEKMDNDRRLANAKKLEEVYREHPEWKNTLGEDGEEVLIDNYDKNGKRTGSSRARK